MSDFDSIPTSQKTAGRGRTRFNQRWPAKRRIRQHMCTHTHENTFSSLECLSLYNIEEEDIRGELETLVINLLLTYSSSFSSFSPSSFHLGLIGYIPWCNQPSQKVRKKKEGLYIAFSSSFFYHQRWSLKGPKFITPRLTISRIRSRTPQTADADQEKKYIKINFVYKLCGLGRLDWITRRVDYI